LTFRSVPLRAAILAVALISSGCYESEVPLDSTPQVSTDARLFGSWRCVSPDAEDNDEVLKLTVTKAGPRTYSVVARDPEETSGYDAYASLIKGTTVLNLRKTSTTRWQFVTYTLLQPDVLRIRLMSDRLLKGVPGTSIRKVIEEQRDNPALYEEYVVCVRLA
jgi:hypothetical protein